GEDRCRTESGCVSSGGRGDGVSSAGGLLTRYHLISIGVRVDGPGDPSCGGDARLTVAATAEWIQAARRSSTVGVVVTTSRVGWAPIACSWIFARRSTRAKA